MSAPMSEAAWPLLLSPVASPDWRGGTGERDGPLDDFSLNGLGGTGDRGGLSEGAQELGTGGNNNGAAADAGAACSGGSADSQG